MDYIAILTALLVLGGFGLLFGLILGISAKKFEVKVDDRIPKIREHLGGANCGACGFAGCDAFATAVVEGKAKADGCPAAGKAGKEAIGKIMGVKVEDSEPMVARVLCQGTSGVAKDRYEYEGYKSCRAAYSLAGGVKECHYSCIGFGDCVKKCAFSAISVKEGIAVIDEAKCRGCGECINECPRSVIKLLPVSQRIIVRCRNNDLGRTAKNACMKACIGCKRCEKECPEGAISVMNNCASIDSLKCTKCGKCAAVCPCGCISVNE